MCKSAFWKLEKSKEKDLILICDKKQAIINILFFYFPTKFWLNNLTLVSRKITN